MNSIKTITPAIRTIDDFNAYFVIDLRASEAKKYTKIKISLIIILSMITISASSYFVNAATGQDKAKGMTPVTQNLENAKTISNKVKMSSTVSGWYKITETSNERLDIETNMQIYINGRTLTKSH